MAQGAVKVWQDDAAQTVRGVKVRLMERIRAHPACDWVSVEKEQAGTCYFVYLKPGWSWSEQTCFGCETMTEALSLLKQAAWRAAPGEAS
jgi:hypothetical protein